MDYKKYEEIHHRLPNGNCLFVSSDTKTNDRVTFKSISRLSNTNYVSAIMENLKWRDLGENLAKFRKIRPSNKVNNFCRI